MTEKEAGRALEIEFGTSGYRGRIADDFTYESVKLVSQAVCDFLTEKYKEPFPSKKIIVGYDTRFLSEEFAKISACVFCANGFNVIFADTFTPPPQALWLFFPIYFYCIL